MAVSARQFFLIFLCCCIQREKCRIVLANIMISLMKRYCDFLLNTFYRRNSRMSFNKISRRWLKFGKIIKFNFCNKQFSWKCTTVARQWIFLDLRLIICNWTVKENRRYWKAVLSKQSGQSQPTSIKLRWNLIFVKLWWNNV